MPRAPGRVVRDREDPEPAAKLLGLGAVDGADAPVLRAVHGSALSRRRAAAAERERAAENQMSGTPRGVLVTAALRVGERPADYAQRLIADEKWCIGCKAWHDIEQFGADRTRTDGRAAACRAARSQRARALYRMKANAGPALRGER
jgi:hypothetical protein